MTKTFRYRGPIFVGFCALLASACGEETPAPKTNTTFLPGQTGDGSTNNPGADAGADGADGSPDPIDGDNDPQEFPPPADGASGDGDADGAADGSDPGDGDADPDPVNPSGVRGTLLNLPFDGDHLAICYGGGDCQGDDLECYAPNGTEPGFCTQDCADDTDCEAIQGVAATCSPTGQCQMGCGSGEGTCPENMVCADLSPLRGTLIPDFRCVYPGDGGKNDVPRYAECDRAHGNGDCADAMKCHAPHLGNTAAPNIGYCADDCGASSDCEVPADTTAAPLCTAGVCEFDCSARGAICPSGLKCVDLDNNLLLATWRCRVE
jgi:hypothetical protein